MNTIKIEVPEGFEIDSFDKTTGEVKLKEKPKRIQDRIKNFQDVLDYHGKKGLEFNLAISLSGSTKDEIAYKKLKLIAEALNEGWKPDWSNSDERKYYPWFDLEHSASGRVSYYGFVSGWTSSGVGSRLCFKSRELAEYAATQFIDIYKDFLIINN